MSKDALPDRSSSREVSKNTVRWALWLPIGLFVAFIILVAVGLLQPAPREITSAMIGKPLPEFTLPAAMDGREGVKSADFRLPLSEGKPRLLNIFASWCIPCAVEAPQLMVLSQEGALIEGIAIRDKNEDVAAFLAQHGNPFQRIGSDVVSAVQLELGSSGVPETFVVDGQGIIRYQHIGEIRPEHLPLLRQKLKEAEQ